MFDISCVPFSRYGSYLVFSILPGIRKFFTGKPGLYLRVLHGDARKGEVFLVEPIDDGGNPLCYTTETSPELLRLTTSTGSLEICMPDEKTVRMRGKGVGVRLSRGSTVVVPQGDHTWLLNIFECRTRFALTALSGKVNVPAPWTGVDCTQLEVLGRPDESGTFEIVLEECLVGWHPREHTDSFDACVAGVRQEFTDFLNRCPSVPEQLAEARRLAAYVNWSAVVAPDGLIKRPAMYMSKNWMTNVWSWDHCFNAIALSYHNFELAWDQFMCMFDFQADNGQLPDSFNNRYFVWNFCKPPIHGWAFRKMMNNAGHIDSEKLETAYNALRRWTQWWFTERDVNRNGIPEYHHGNDSGWDNSTVFLGALPIETPELSAFLVIQMEVLANIAAKLGRTEESIDWREKADVLLKKLQEYFWNGDRFIAKDYRGNPVFCDSLLLYVPVVLGKRLPHDIRQSLVAGLRDGGGFLTEYGLATESPNSPYYEPDGYWRGPIWAPATMLIVDGLADMGEYELVKEISARFAKMAVKSGFAENYDPLTGCGLRDRAYTWTSSVFLILAHEYLPEDFGR